MPDVATPSPLRRAVVALAVGGVAGAVVALVIPRARGGRPPGGGEGAQAAAR